MRLEANKLIQLSSMSCWPGRGNEFQLFMTKSAAALRKVMEPVVEIRLTACSRVRLEKLVGSELLKKFPRIYGTRMFMPVFTTARQFSPPTDGSSPRHPIRLFKVYFNVTLSFTCRFSKRCFLQVLRQKLVRICQLFASVQHGAPL